METPDLQSDGSNEKLAQRRKKKSKHDANETDFTSERVTEETNVMDSGVPNDSGLAEKEELETRKKRKKRKHSSAEVEDHLPVQSADVQLEEGEILRGIDGLEEEKDNQRRKQKRSKKPLPHSEVCQPNFTEISRFLPCIFKRMVGYIPRIAGQKLC